MATERVTVTKTCKLLIDGAFPRSESGRVLPLLDARGRTVAQVAHASRKDLRDAVEAAAAAQPRWAQATAYLRGQVLYRMAETLEARTSELAAAIRQVEPSSAATARREVERSVDRLVSLAGWADKLAMVLGNQNPVAGPFYTFSVPEPSGVVAVVAPDRPSLLGLVTLLAAPLASGNAVVALASERNPLPAVALMEIVATSDVPAGAVNLLTGLRGELLPHIASHREIHAVAAALDDAQERRTLELGQAENLKRVHVFGQIGKAVGKATGRPAALDWDDDRTWSSPSMLARFVETKTVWHPTGA
jgi:acyl-CoA reductase-like NAD-dependent aldehyde dehydrogenase